MIGLLMVNCLYKENNIENRLALAKWGVLIMGLGKYLGKKADLVY